jgi:hypothetical protein
MSFGILWISRVALSLLIVALITALVSRCKRMYWRKIWPIVAALIVFITVIPLAIVGGYLLWENMQPKWLFWYGLSETILYLIGAIIVLKKGLKGVGTEEQAARSWSRRWLAVSFGMAVFIFVVTLNFAETRIVAHVANVSNMATHKLISLLPANLPVSLNAFPVYEEAAQMLGSGKDLPSWFSEIDQPDFDASRGDVQNFLATHHNTLAAIRRATAMQGYSMEVDASDLFNAHIPSYIPYRNLARLLRLSVLDLIASDNSELVAQELHHISEMGDHLRSFPLLLSVIISFAIDNTYYTSLEYLLAKEPGHHIFQIELPVTPRPSVLNSFLNSLRLEAYSHLQLFASTASSYDYFSLFNSNSLLKFDCGCAALLVTLWRVFLLPSDIKAAKDIIAYRMGKPEATYEEHRKDIDFIKESRDSGNMGIFTKIAAPNTTGYADRAMFCDVQRGLCDLALALTAYKAINNEYPATLEELTPSFIGEIPLDPFDGTQLKMALVEGGLRLFSTGPDKESDRYTKSLLQLDFYLGGEAFYNYRVKPAKEKEEKGKK